MDDTQHVTLNRTIQDGYQLFAHLHVHVRMTRGSCDDSLNDAFVGAVYS